jgi:hypothetical protein
MDTNGAGHPRHPRQAPNRALGGKRFGLLPVNFKRNKNRTEEYPNSFPQLTKSLEY